MPSHRRAVLALVITAALVFAVIPGLTGPASADVPSSQDNPPGCVTAKSTLDTQCGAQGRDHFALPQHRPPIEACATHSAPSGSVITRVLPDGPLRADGSLAFVSGACVYLPPGYENSGLSYPVVYLLHGGGGDEANWVTFGGVQQLLDAQYAQDPAHAVIAVMPDGYNGNWYDFYNKSFLVQTYFLDYVIPYVDSHFRTIADRRGRVIEGLSNGGYGAAMFAAKAPDRFVAAGLMSANIEADDFEGLYEPMVSGRFRSSSTDGVVGAETYYYGNLPKNLVPNLDHVDLVIDVGGTCSTNDVLIDGCSTWAYPEALFRVTNENFKQALDDNHYAGTCDFRESEGSHAWRWWIKWFTERDLPFFYERMLAPMPTSSATFTPTPPGSFRYRSISPTFSVWGYDVTVQRQAEEFLDLDTVTAAGFQIRGTGSAVITTAARYRQGTHYTVAGTGPAGPVTLTADRSGRLRIPVDLGPSHVDNQYSVPGMALSGTAGYFVTRTVTIREPGGRIPS
jgi:S-formylglutathione hydrolase FrmB